MAIRGARRRRATTVAATVILAEALLGVRPAFAHPVSDAAPSTTQTHSRYSDAPCIDGLDDPKVQRVMKQLTQPLERTDSTYEIGSDIHGGELTYSGLEYFAEKNGVPVPIHPPAVHQRPGESTARSSLRWATNYLGEFGTKLSVPKQFSTNDITPLDVANASGQIGEVTAAYMFLSPIYSTITPPKTLQLVDEIAGAGGLAYSTNDVALASNINERAQLHESAHLIIQALFGDMDATGCPSLAQLFKQTPFQPNPDDPRLWPAYDALRSDLVIWGYTTTAYGGTQPSEALAELLMSFTSGERREWLADHVATQELAIIFATLEERVPGITQFYLDIRDNIVNSGDETDIAPAFHFFRTVGWLLRPGNYLATVRLHDETVAQIFATAPLVPQRGVDHVEQEVTIYVAPGWTIESARRTPSKGIALTDVSSTSQNVRVSLNASRAARLQEDVVLRDPEGKRHAISFGFTAGLTSPTNPFHFQHGNGLVPSVESTDIDGIGQQSTLTLAHSR